MPKCKYVGDKNEAGEPHGRGMAVFERGKYRGDWVNGAFHGTGELILNNGLHYVGEFSCNKMHGNGKLRFGDGRLYEGELRNGKLHGNGELVGPHWDVHRCIFRRGSAWEGKDGVR